MTQMQTDKDQELKSGFVKIIDEKVADNLSVNYGFSYITEQINCGQTVYVFENSDALQSVLGELVYSSYSEGVPIVYCSSLCF